MSVKPSHLVLSALGLLLCTGMPLPADAQQVYKCGSGYSVVYTEKPCAGRRVSTEQAPVPAKPNPRNLDLRKLEEAQAMARSLRRKPDESAEQFDMRRRRTALLAQDRAECARIDMRMPVEAASLTNPDPGEVMKADISLRGSRKRFVELRC